MTPTGIYDIAQTALNCVCSAMDDLAADVETYPGCPCLVYVSAGESAIDCCDDQFPCGDGGMLTVHIEDVFPSDLFPVATEEFAPCKAATWVASLVVTASRCAPSMSDEGNMSSAEELSASAELMALDQYAVLTALGCCLVNDPPAGKSKRRVKIQGSRPLVSEGGCASVEVRALVEIDRVCACAPATS